MGRKGRSRKRAGAPGAMLFAAFAVLAASCDRASLTPDGGETDSGAPGAPDAGLPDAGLPDALELDTADAQQEAPLCPGMLFPAVPRIRDNEPPCRYDLPPEPSTLIEYGMDVFVNATRIPMDGDHANGWDYLDFEQQIIELYGPACGAWPDGGAQPLVDVRFRCLLP